jgi:polyisoprenoid-binding protein YceI
MLGPRTNFAERALEGATFFGKLVLDTNRTLGHNPANDQLLRLKGAQALGKHAISDVRNRALDESVTDLPLEEGLDNRASPPAADELDCAVETRTNLLRYGVAGHEQSLEIGQLDTRYLLKYTSKTIVSPVRTAMLRGLAALRPQTKRNQMTAPATTAPSTGAKTAWKLDPSHTLVEFSAKHMMITTVKGRITDVEGTIHTDERDPKNSSVEATLKATSIDTRTDQRDQHLRSADFLNVEKYPVIKFRSTRIEGDKEHFKLTGDLTIRDTTRPITLDVHFEGRTKDPWGGERVGFSAKGKIDRRDFGLTWNQALETGGLLVGNDIKIELEVQAVKQA